MGMAGLLFMTPWADLVQWCHSGPWGRAWQQLHKLVYLRALLGMLHFYWKKAAKNDFSVVMVYALILAVLLGWRVMRKGGSRPCGGSADMLDLVLLFVPFFALVVMGWGRPAQVRLRWMALGLWIPLCCSLACRMVFQLSASGALQQSGLLSLLLAYGLAGGSWSCWHWLGLCMPVCRGVMVGWSLWSRPFQYRLFGSLPLLTNLLGAQAPVRGRYLGH